MHAKLWAVVLALVMMWLLIIMIGGAGAASKCLSRSEARTLYPRTYLYWHREGNQRCWSSRRGGGAAMPHRSPRQAVVVPRLPPPPPIILPAGLMPPLLSVVVPPSILDSPRWAWVAEARAEAHADDVPFSTFSPGTEPDVWPRLEPAIASTGEMIVVLFAGALAFAFGLGLWRWRLNRVRIA